MKKRFLSMVLSVVMLSTVLASGISAYADIVSGVNDSDSAYSISIGQTRNITFKNNYSEWINDRNINLLDQSEGWLKFTVTKPGYYEVSVLNPNFGGKDNSVANAVVKTPFSEDLFATSINNGEKESRGAGRLEVGTYLIEVNCLLLENQTYTAQVKLTEHVHDYRIVSSAYSYSDYFCRVCGAPHSKDVALKPKKISITKLAPSKKALTVNWQKPANASGYQIQVATDSSFKNNKKTATVTNPSTLSKKVTGLKAKKKYYVRVRTYTKANGSKKYSSWSKVKSAKVK